MMTEERARARLRSDAPTWPTELSHEMVQQRFVGGPDIKNWTLVMLGGVQDGRIYKREGDLWYLLDDKPRSVRP